MWVTSGFDDQIGHYNRQYILQFNYKNLKMSPILPLLLFPSSYWQILLFLDLANRLTKSFVSSIER